MKFEDMFQAFPSKEDIARVVGLPTRASTTGDILTAFGLFGTGMIVGAGLTLLVAPKTGHEIHQGIAGKISKIANICAGTTLSHMSKTRPAPEPWAQRESHRSDPVSPTGDRRQREIAYEEVCAA